MIKDWELVLYWIEKRLGKGAIGLTAAIFVFWASWEISTLRSPGVEAFMLLAIPIAIMVWACYAAIFWLQPHRTYVEVWTKLAGKNLGDFPVGEEAEDIVARLGKKILQMRAMEVALSANGELQEKLLKFADAWSLLTRSRGGVGPVLRGEQYRQTAREYLLSITEERFDDTCRGLTFG